MSGSPRRAAVRHISGVEGGHTQHIWVRGYGPSRITALLRRTRRGGLSLVRHERIDEAIAAT